MNKKMGLISDQPQQKTAQRDALGKALLMLGEKYPHLFVLSPDVGTSTKAIEFGKKFPERYACTGIAEMNTVGIAAGLSTMGFIPLVAGYAMFVAGKAWEPFRNSVAYPHLNVKIVGTHAGINVGPDGVTHQAIEDIALMRSIPGVEVYTPGDASQVLPALDRAMQVNGPVYIRLERAPMLDLNLEISKNKLEDYYLLKPDGEIAILAIGGMIAPSLEAAQVLKRTSDIDVRVIGVSVIKPIKVQLFFEQLRGIKGVVTAEDHNMFGGFGGSIAEILSKEKPLPLEMIALKDTFACSGESSNLKNCFGLTSENIQKAVLRIRERIEHE
jgi:transketolase